MNSTLVVRKSDRAIFEPAWVNWKVSPYQFWRVVPVKRSYWFGIRLARNGDSWSTTNEKDFDVVEKRDVLAGLRMR
jgi:hypothetical protein